MTAQPPGFHHSTLRVATHGQQVVPPFIMSLSSSMSVTFFAIHTILYHTHNQKSRGVRSEERGSHANGPLQPIHWFGKLWSRQVQTVQAKWGGNNIIMTHPVCVCVCVCVYIYIYPTHPLGQDMTKGQFLSGV